MRIPIVWLILLLGLSFPVTEGKAASMLAPGDPATPDPAGQETVTVGGGCFWCMEAIFSGLKGVHSVESGFSGGSVPKPTYEQVCTGTTGHAEVVQVTFDPKVLPLHDLLSVFFTMHDPTTLNRQGPDSGTQYRSVIFYRNPGQKAVAETVMKEVTAAKIWDGALVTQLSPFAAFWKAEGYHQDYFQNNPNQPYCRAVIEPKVRKFREKFRDRLAQP
jgi:peptide-methionine (S)-S-oxide reductase